MSTNSTVLLYCIVQVLRGVLLNLNLSGSEDGLYQKDEQTEAYS